MSEALTQPLNILFVIKTMSLPGGGAERVLATVTRGLQRRGHKVTILSHDVRGSPDYYPTTARRIRQGIPAGNPHGRLRRMLSWLPTLRRLIVNEQPDVAIGFMHSGYLPLSLACLGTGVPVLASEHTVFQHYRSRTAERLLIRIVPYMVDGLTVVSEQARGSFPRALRHKMRVVPNPVDEPAPIDAPARCKGRLLLVAVGRLDIAKDHATLIDAFARVACDWPEWDLEIAGEGECRAKLEQQITSLGLQERVRLLGAVSDIDALLGRADLFAMASRYESFGLATAEALMRSVPAVGFADCPGTNELIINCYNGLLIQPGKDRASSLAAGLSSLFADSDLRHRLAANAPSTVLQFREHAVLDRWEQVLRDTVRARNGGD